MTHHKSKSHSDEWNLYARVGSNHPVDNHWVVITSYGYNLLYTPLPLSTPPPPPWTFGSGLFLVGYYTLRFSHLLNWIVRVPLIDANFLSSNLSSTILFFISLYEGGFLCSLLLNIKYLTRIKI